MAIIHQEKQLTSKFQMVWVRHGGVVQEPHRDGRFVQERIEYISGTSPCFGKTECENSGGTHIMTSAEWFQNLAGGSFLSPTGQRRPFD